MKINKHMKQVGEIKDRGIIKWQGMFLTEHVEMIKAWREEETKVPKPDLTEVDLQLIQEEIEIAMKRKCIVQIKTWKNDQIQLVEGIIEEIDFRNKVIVYNDSIKKRRVPVNEVVAIDIIE